MNCAEVRTALRAGALPDGSDLENHVAGCVSCEALLTDDLSQVPDRVDLDDALPAHLLEIINQAVADDVSIRARLRGLSTPVRWMLGVGAIAAIGLLNLLLLPRVDLDVYPGDRWLAITSVFFLYAVFATVGALRSLHRPRPVAWVAPSIALATIGIPLIVAFLPEAHRAHPASLLGVTEDFVPRAVGCFIYGLVSALPVFVVLGILNRYGHGAWRAGLLAASASALAAAIALHVHCPLVSTMHILAGHVTVGVAILGTYASIRRFV